MKSLEECGASPASVEELVSATGKSFSSLCRCFWEIRRKGTAKRGEVFGALRSEGLKFGTQVSSALWSLADKFQTSTSWTSEMSDAAEKAAREAAKADSVKHTTKKSSYDKAVEALSVLSSLLKEDDRSLQPLAALTLCVDNLKPVDAPAPVDNEDAALMAEFMADVAASAKTGETTPAKTEAKTAKAKTGAAPVAA